MLAIKAKYEKGHIQLLEPMPPDIESAELHVIVIPESRGQSNLNISAQEYRVQPGNSEAEFKAIGLAAFFDTEDDANIDWEEHFGLK